MNFKKILVPVIAGLVIVIIILITTIVLWYGPGGKKDRYVLIPPKSGTIAISNILKKNNVIRSSMFFRLVAGITGQSRSLKAGEYKFLPNKSIGEALRKLVSGEVVHHTITIPEGYTAKQIAARLAEEKIIAEETFMAVVNDAAVVREFNLPTNSLEGFLFPDTYEFAKGMTAIQIAKRMVKQFREKVDNAIIHAANEQGVDFKELVTMASIIEREVRVPKERPMVASVFYNRIAKRMRLESCATVLYSQNRVSGSLSLEDLQTKSPYNTYRRRGLPPGPICNPGLSAIKAAAYPAKNNYLFFVVRPDGEHVFSENFEEHKRAKWRQKRAKRKSKKQQ